MLGDIFPYPSYYTNVTGLTDYFNFDSPAYPNNPFDVYLNRADVKQALNVDPSYVYSSGNGTVEEYLLADWMQSVEPKLTALLNSGAYQIMICEWEGQTRHDRRARDTGREARGATIHECANAVRSRFCFVLVLCVDCVK